MLRLGRTHPQNVGSRECTANKYVTAQKYAAARQYITAQKYVTTQKYVSARKYTTTKIIFATTKQICNYRTTNSLTRMRYSAQHICYCTAAFCTYGPQ